MSKEKTAADYRQRIADYEKLISIEQNLLTKARRAKDPDSELAMRRAEIRRLSDLRQLAFQITKDLENL